MESLGEFLKQKRSDEGITLEQIEKETRIAKKYLSAIEADEFSEFPGEAYLKGFLRSYATYLKLDPEEIINMYERIKIAETQTPMELLIPKPKRNFIPLIVILAIISVVGLSGTGGFFLYKYMQKNKDKIIQTRKDRQEKKKQDNSNIVYTISENEMTKTIDLKNGDTVEITANNQKHKVAIKELTPAVVINYGEDKELYLLKDYNHEVDLDNDDINDAVLYLNFWDSKSANINFSLITQETSVNSPSLKGFNKEIIVKNANKESIQLELLLRESTFLRYKIDDNEEVQGFFNKDTVKKLNAEKYLIIWLSNAGIVNLDFKKYNKQIIAGESGQIAVKMINWEKNSDDEYELQISSLN